MKAAGLVASLLLVTGLVHAAEFYDAKVEQLIAQEQEPDGVVFELMTWEDNSWNWAVPLLGQFIRQLQQRFPGLDVALVSHGAEMFDLSLRADKKDDPAIKQLEGLYSNGLEVHVSADYAKYKRLDANSFLDFVDVPDSSDAQLENYQQLGFVLIRLLPSDAAVQ
ncbi:MAG: intracellular sulfur oxidation DsrE/DsrF family protein [Planctomycetota bacterium]|jgi:intracellular sulfur oxidation DsrE/DsrF family protein